MNNRFYSIFWVYCYGYDMTHGNQVFNDQFQRRLRPTIGAQIIDVTNILEFLKIYLHWSQATKRNLRREM